MRVFVCVLLAGTLMACGSGSGDDDDTTVDAAVGTVDAADECAGCINGDGDCVPGAADSACGHSGNACVACTGTDVCAEGVCDTPPACGSSNCSGCCDGDTCLGGTADGACGSGGFACEVCSSELGATCVGGACHVPCSDLTCSGCCDGGTCVGGTDDDACGKNGDDCSNCASNTCISGVCVNTSCAESCSGCCSGDTCLGGDSDSACGDSGAACEDCGDSRMCESGDCVVDPTSRWDVVVTTGEVNEQNCDFEAWDSFGGLPDPYVSMITSEGPDTETGISTTDDDTLQPLWNDVVLEDIPARLLLNYFYMRVWDDDLGPADDDMGQCSVPLDDSAFSDTLLTLVCPRNTTGGQAGFTVRFRIRPH